MWLVIQFVFCLKLYDGKYNSHLYKLTFGIMPIPLCVQMRPPPRIHFNFFKRAPPITLLPCPRWWLHVGQRHLRTLPHTVGLYCQFCYQFVIRWALRTKCAIDDGWLCLYVCCIVCYTYMIDNFLWYVCYRYIGSPRGYWDWIIGTSAFVSVCPKWVRTYFFGLPWKVSACLYCISSSPMWHIT